MASTVPGRYPPGPAAARTLRVRRSLHATGLGTRRMSASCYEPKAEGASGSDTVSPQLRSSPGGLGGEPVVVFTRVVDHPHELVDERVVGRSGAGGGVGLVSVEELWRRGRLVGLRCAGSCSPGLVGCSQHRVAGCGLVATDGAVDGDARAFDAAALAVVGERAAHGQAHARQESHAAGASAATAAGLADGLDVVQSLEAEEGVFAGRAGQPSVRTRTRPVQRRCGEGSASMGSARSVRRRRWSRRSSPCGSGCG